MGLPLGTRAGERFGTGDEVCTSGDLSKAVQQVAEIASLSVGALPGIHARDNYLLNSCCSEAVCSDPGGHQNKWFMPSESRK